MYLIVLIIGFLFVGTVPKLLGISESSLSIQYRVFILGLSLFLIFKTFFSKYLGRVDVNQLALFFIFWIIYSIRIVNDLYFDPIKLYLDTPASNYSQFAFGVVLVPSIAIILIIQTYDINLKWVLKWVYRSLFITLSIALYFRSGSEAVGRDAGDINVGIILFGQFGATLAILSAYFLVKEKYKVISSMFYVLSFMLGVAGIFVSASKSPFVALIAVLLLFFALWYRNLKSLFIMILVGTILSIYSLEIGSFLNNYFNSNFLERLLYAIEIGGDKAREGLLYAALNEFIESPVFGNALLIQKENMEGSYPHNLLVEAFMATGIIGGSLFTLWLLKCLKMAVLAIRSHSENSWIALLFLQFLIFGMFSKNLYSNDLFWFFSILIISSAISTKHQMKVESKKLEPYRVDSKPIRLK